MSKKRKENVPLLNATFGGEGDAHTNLIWDEENMPDKRPTIPELDGLVAQIICGQCPLCQPNTHPDLVPLNLEPGWYCRAGLKRLKRPPIYLGEERPITLSARMSVPPEYLPPLSIMQKWPESLGGVVIRTMVLLKSGSEFLCEKPGIREDALVLPDMFDAQKRQSLQY